MSCPPCDGKAPPGWLTYDEIYGDYVRHRHTSHSRCLNRHLRCASPLTVAHGHPSPQAGNGFLCTPACCTVKVAKNYEGTACEGTCKGLPCYEANCCSPPCCSQVYVFQGCMGMAPGSFPFCLPTAFAPQVGLCCKKNTYSGGGGACVHYTDKDTFNQACFCCCCQVCDLPCGYKRVGVTIASGAPENADMVR